MFHRLFGDERGAVTIDWVALVSGLLLLGIAVIYAIFNTGVASVTSQINAALGAIGIIDAGTAPDYGGNAGGGGDVVVNNDLVLADGTMVPLGSKVVDVKLMNVGGVYSNVIVLETPDGNHTAIVSGAQSGGLPPTDSKVTAGNTVTAQDGTVYDMSGYTGAPPDLQL